MIMLCTKQDWQYDWSKFLPVFLNFSVKCWIYLFILFFEFKQFCDAETGAELAGWSTVIAVFIAIPYNLWIIYIFFINKEETMYVYHT